MDATEKAEGYYEYIIQKSPTIQKINKRLAEIEEWIEDSDRVEKLRRKVNQLQTERFRENWYSKHPEERARQEEIDERVRKDVEHAAKEVLWEEERTKKKTPI